MELDDLDEPEPASIDELTSSTTFMEERTDAQPPPQRTFGLYDEENANIPSESNQVSDSHDIQQFSNRLFFRDKVMILIQLQLSSPQQLKQ
jgi:hypothetical protein